MLPEKNSRRNQLTLAFLGLTLILLVVAAVGTVNYYRFYPALSQIRVNLTSLQPTRANDSLGNPVLTVKVTFAVENPTDYDGLYLRSIESTWEIIDIMSPTTNATFPQGPFPYVPAKGPLNPGNVVSVTIPPINATGGVVALASQPNTKLEFVFHPNLILSSFLNKVAVLIISYECSSSGAPSACGQAGLVLEVVGGASGGGGGGGGV